MFMRSAWETIGQQATGKLSGGSSDILVSRGRFVTEQGG